METLHFIWCEVVPKVLLVAVLSVGVCYSLNAWLKKQEEYVEYKAKWFK